MARPQRNTPWLQARAGIYYAYWYDASRRSTKRLSLRTGNSTEAENRFAEFLINGREIRDARSGRLDVTRALDDYLAEHARKHCADVVRQENAIVHLKAFFGDRSIEDIDIPQSRDYAQARRDGVIGGGKRHTCKVGSDSTIRRELNVLRAASNHAKKWKRINSLPSIELPREKTLGPDDEAPYYTTEEVDAIFAAAEKVGGELEWFAKLLYYTGARRRSIEALTMAQVNWRARRIHLQAPGKIATKKRQPIVPILRVMEVPLKALTDRARTPRLFECADFYRPYRELVESVGIVDRVKPHTMRHSRATHLLQDGKSLYDVAKLLGDTVATVERVYGHHSWEALASALEG